MSQSDKGLAKSYKCPAHILSDAHFFAPLDCDVQVIISRLTKQMLVIDTAHSSDEQTHALALLVHILAYIQFYILHPMHGINTNQMWEHCLETHLFDHVTFDLGHTHVYTHLHIHTHARVRDVT